MGFVEIGIQLLIMIKNFILLCKFNMPAHHNNRLAHEEHKKSADERQYQQYYTGVQYLCFESAVSFIELVDKYFNQRIIIGLNGGIRVSIFFFQAYLYG